jgi:hypothetical protein
MQYNKQQEKRVDVRIISPFRGFFFLPNGQYKRIDTYSVKWIKSYTHQYLFMIRKEIAIENQAENINIHDWKSQKWFWTVK